MHGNYSEELCNSDDRSGSKRIQFMLTMELSNVQVAFCVFALLHAYYGKTSTVLFAKMRKVCLSYCVQLLKLFLKKKHLFQRILTKNFPKLHFSFQTKKNFSTCMNLFFILRTSYVPEHLLIKPSPQSVLLYCTVRVHLNVKKPSPLSHKAKISPQNAKRASRENQQQNSCFVVLLHYSTLQQIQSLKPVLRCEVSRDIDLDFPPSSFPSFPFQFENINSTHNVAK